MNKHVQTLLAAQLSNLKVAQETLAEALSDVQTQRAKDFAAAGGCSTCGGRGWVVTWDTLDSLSGCYAEYGTCPEPTCTPASRQASGLDRSYHSKYDGLKGVPKHGETEAEQDVLVPLRVAVSVCQADLAAAEDALRPAVKGRVVQVVGGRKVPQGTTGTVVWVGEGRSYGCAAYGSGYRHNSRDAVPLRLGVKDAAGTVHWTAADNCVAVVAGPPG